MEPLFSPERLQNGEKQEIKDRLAKFIVQESYTHEYQVLCKEMEPKFGKGIWAIPHMHFVTDEKLRKAWDIAQKRGVYKLGYLIGILRKL